MGCCSINRLDMKRFLSSEQEGDDHFELLDKYTETTKDWISPGLKNTTATKQSELESQVENTIGWNLNYSATQKVLPTTTPTFVKSDVAGFSTLITRSLPEEDGIFRATQMSEDRDSNSYCSSNADTCTTDTTSSNFTIKKRKKTKAEREARRVNPDIYAPSLRPRFVICKGCNDELWPPNCRYHSRHCEFAARIEANSGASGNPKEQEDKIAVENLVND
ncbi:hypothetical protein GpartN1_g5158.t1 [Galdieria partita]|uniref:Uncharacterized protein n=1 Tax=Galdieria partita TaxID=83374 RepID=A0A9C7Q0N6_9RHOD|nr:hypothetical protein GpartN1_g5158.t1 [Galdieria partita]